MAEDKESVGTGAAVSLESAALAFVRSEIERLAEAIIDELKTMAPAGTFGDVVEARHMWDEYCWNLQEGPFDEVEMLGGVSLGSISGNWQEMILASSLGAIEKLPRHLLVLLSASALDEDDETSDAPTCACIWPDGIAERIVSEVEERASRRRLDLIGPDRGDVIPHELEGTGLVWEALPDATSIITEHVDAMVDADADLSDAASQLVGAFMEVASEQARGTVFADFLERFEDEVRALLLEKDVLPSLAEMRDVLSAGMDR